MYHIQLTFTHLVLDEVNGTILRASSAIELLNSICGSVSNLVPLCVCVCVCVCVCARASIRVRERGRRKGYSMEEL